MNASGTATVILAALALIGALAAFVRWFYVRGRDEQKLAGSVDNLTEATTELAGQVGGLRTTIEKHSETLTEHHWRIRALEEKAPVKVTVESP